jgi:hypothetical protein
MVLLLEFRQWTTKPININILISSQQYRKDANFTPPNPLTSLYANYSTNLNGYSYNNSQFLTNPPAVGQQQLMSCRPTVQPLSIITPTTATTMNQYRIVIKLTDFLKLSIFSWTSNIASASNDLHNGECSSNRWKVLFVLERSQQQSKNSGHNFYATGRWCWTRSDSSR